LHREVLARGRRGGRVDLNQLVFRQMVMWLQQVVEEQRGVADAVATERPLQS
jgi:type II secretory pathway component PulM